MQNSRRRVISAIEVHMRGWSIGILTLLAGCMKMVAPEAAGDEGGYGVPMPAAPPPAPRSAPASRSYQSVAGGAGAVAAPSTPQAQRMVHYAGYVQLRVQEPSETIDTLTALVKAADGYVEQLSGATLTVRVPVARFEEVYKAVLSAGEVLSRTLTAEDVTESFTAIDLRLSAARAQQARLIDLLSRAKTEQEKIVLVQQIQQVTEQIDTLEGQLRTLKGLADFSRITVTLQKQVPLAGGPAADESGAFAWIAGLTPFSSTLSSHGAPVDLDIPQGLVKLTARPLAAESADGARLRTSRIPNEPRGDNDFWMDALQRRMAKEFALATVMKLGDWSVLRLVDRSENPYRYWVGVQADGKDLLVVELYFPTGSQEDRYRKAVEDVLRDGAPLADEGAP